LRDSDGATLDRGMVLWMPGPNSYTGEDSAELYLHGGRAVLDGVADSLVGLGLRPADPGEFTRRAFLNGRMDLIEAEAVHDLVESETAEQRRQALRQLDGALGALYRGWADRLQVLLAHQEALIDFPEEDLPADVEAAIIAELDALAGEVAVHLADDRRGERLREGLTFAVVGAPNVGKSSLVNALAERDVAIVSPLPGTTRDTLETRLVLGGVPVTLVDTAGLREAAGAIEAEGVRRARARAAEADLIVAVIEAGSIGQVEADPDRRMLQVANKIDLCGLVPRGAIGLSALTGEGLGALRRRLAEEARALIESSGSPPLTRARHRAALEEAGSILVEAREADWPELRAESLRLALRALGRVTGEVATEEILDLIFGQFCIGK
jgi:tRNA modification GTPase